MSAKIQLIRKELFEKSFELINVAENFDEQKPGRIRDFRYEEMRKEVRDAIESHPDVVLDRKLKEIQEKYQLEKQNI